MLCYGSDMSEIKGDVEDAGERGAQIRQETEWKKVLKKQKTVH